MTTFAEGEREAPRHPELEQRLEALLEQKFPGQVISLRIVGVAPRFKLSGAVASEACRAAAVRLLASFDGISEVVDRLEVTAFFVPAAPDEEWLWGEASHFSQHIDDAADHSRKFDEVSRYPSIVSDAAPVVGQKLKIIVDLTVDKGPESVGDAISFGAFPAGWTRIDVDVRLHAPMLKAVTPEVASIILREDGSSQAAVFEAVVSEDAAHGAPIVVTAHFYYGARFSGQCVKDFGPAGVETTTLSPDRATVVVIPGAAEPDLTVTISRLQDNRFRWFWTVPRGAALSVGRTSGDNDLGQDAASYARSLLVSCPTMSDADFRRRMRGIGEQIWSKAPEGFRTAYLELRSQRADFSIQFVSDDPFVPWELMRPGGPGDIDHLFIGHPIARWPLDVGGWLTHQLPGGSIESFVPEYRDDGTLPAARREGQALVDRFKASAAKATKAEFLKLLECADGKNSVVGIVHFAGHGRADSGRRDGGILMENDEWVVLDEIRQSQVRLGEQNRSLVVLNACEMASAELELGLVDGWAPALAERRFGAIIAPLWRVQDEAASDIVLATLRGLLEDGLPLGQALSEARAAVCDRSVAAFSFLAFGDVMARVGGR